MRKCILRPHPVAGAVQLCIPAIKIASYDLLGVLELERFIVGMLYTIKLVGTAGRPPRHVRPVEVHLESQNYVTVWDENESLRFS